MWSFKVSGVCVYVIGLKLNFRCHYLEKYLVLEIGKHYGLTNLLSLYTYIYTHIYTHTLNNIFIAHMFQKMSVYSSSSTAWQ